MQDNLFQGNAIVHCEGIEGADGHALATLLHSPNGAQAKARHSRHLDLRETKIHPQVT